MLEYEVMFAPAEEGGFVVTFPDFGRGVTQEETEPDAMLMAADLLMGSIGDCMEDGNPLPAARKHRGNITGKFGCLSWLRPKQPCIGH